MATPANTSTEITLAKVRNELATNAYGTAYTAGETSLYQASIGTYGTINTGNASADRPDGTAPHSLSEFYNYDHDLTTNIHATSLTNGNTGGYGFARSGFLISSFGSISDATISSFDGASTFSITALHSHATSSSATSGTITFRVVNSSGSGASNSGFTTLKLWLQQSNDSGSPDLTLSRSTASYSGSGGTRTWIWNVSVSSSSVYFTYFGGNNAYSYFMEIV